MAAIIAALYLVIMIESMTAGVSLYYVIEKSIELCSVPMEDRKLDTVLTFAFWVLALAGFVISLPCFCYALHKRNGQWFYPYLIWRLTLIALVIALTIYICVNREEHQTAQDYQGNFYLALLLPVGIEICLGILFFWFAFYAMRYFARFRITTVDRLIAY